MRTVAYFAQADAATELARIPYLPSHLLSPIADD